MKISLSFLFIFAFPYFSLGYGDTSPFLFLWVSLVGVSRLIYLRRSFGKAEIIWISTTILISLLYLIGDDNNSSLRVVAYGLMIPLCSIIFKNPDLYKLYRTAKLVRFIYLFVSLVQLAVGMDSYAQVTSALMNIRYADGRGLVSVGPEPTAFAVLYLLFAITAYYINQQVKPARANKILVTDLLLIFAITLSSSYALYIVMFLVFNSIFRGGFLRIIFILFSFYALSGLFVALLPDLRLSSILVNLGTIGLKDFENLLFIIDESVLDRLSQPLIAIWFSFANYMLPTQPSEIINYAATLSPAFDYLLSDRYNRVHLNTGLGELVVFYGALSLYPLYKIFGLFRQSADCGLMFLIIYFFSIPFGHPSYWSALAICNFVLIHSKNNKILNSSPVSAVKGC